MSPNVQSKDLQKDSALQGWIFTARAYGSHLGSPASSGFLTTSHLPDLLTQTVLVPGTPSFISFLRLVRFGVLLKAS